MYLHHCVHLQFTVAFFISIALSSNRSDIKGRFKSGLSLATASSLILLSSLKHVFPISVVEPSGIVCHRYSKYWWLVKLESWCWHFVTVIRVEQVMLYLSLVMDHIIVLFSNSLPGAEEPPCSVTLIRWSKSPPILFSPDLYWEEDEL